MHPYPHHYDVRAHGVSAGSSAVEAEGLATLPVAPPIQFDGPGDRWSPERLLVAAAASCFVLTFRSVATFSKLAWTRLDCDVDGTLERSEGVTRFTGLHLRARLVVPPGQDAARAQRLLEKAEKSCVVTSSLKLEPSLTTDVVVEG